MRLFGRKRPFRRAWKRIFGRWRLSDKRYFNRVLRTSIMRKLNSVGYYHRAYPWYMAEQKEREAQRVYDRLKREEKRLKNLAFHYPPFLPTHDYAGNLWPDVPGPSASLIESITGIRSASETLPPSPPSRPRREN